MANKLTLSAVGLLSLLAVGMFAQTATTDPVGFVKLPTLASSDTVVAPPLERPTAYQGLVSAIAGSVITVQGNPAWAANQFLYAAGVQTGTYYVRILSGARAGAYFTVLGNLTNSLTVDLNGDTLGTVVAGDKISITPYWTLGSLFPASDEGTSFAKSANVAQHGTEVFFLDQSAVGLNPSTAATFFFYNGAWRKVKASIGDSFNDTALILPDSYFIVRNRALTGTLTVVGSVLMSPIQIGLNAIPASKQDNIVSLKRPVDVSLDASGLITSGAFSTSTNPAMHTDELLVFDNTLTGVNKSAAGTYFHYNGAWRKVKDAITANHGSDLVFAAGTGVIIRKAKTVGAETTTLWINSPTY